MSKSKISPIEIENCPIMFKNFAGKERPPFNAEGNRNFCAVIEDERLAERLQEDGWNVKCLAGHGDEQPPRYYIQVAVAYKYNPPKIFMMTKHKRVSLDESTVETLDYAEIVRNENGDQVVDLIITPYEWNLKSGSSGVKAYLKSMYVTIEEDRFAEKYADYGEDDDERNMPF